MILSSVRRLLAEKRAVDDSGYRVNRAIVVFGRPRQDPLDFAVVIRSFAVGIGQQFRDEAADKAISIRVPNEHRNELDTIIALELDGPAADIEPKRADWGPSK